MTFPTDVSQARLPYQPYAPTVIHKGMAPKDWVLVIVAILGAFSTLGVIHAKFILPGVLVAAEQRMDNLIEAHSTHPHPGAVQRSEFQLVMARFDELATKESVTHVQALLGTIQDSQRRLEDRMLRLEEKK